MSGEMRIDTGDAVNISYPGFIRKMAVLGAGKLRGPPLGLQSSWS